MNKKDFIAYRHVAKLPPIVAFDFDGTITLQDEYPNIGKPNIEVIKTIRDLQLNGVKVILWTCRDGAALEEAITFVWPMALSLMP